MPISRGDYLHKDHTEEHFCVFCVDLVYCFNVCLSPALYNILHMSMTQHSLFVLKVPENTNQPSYTLFEATGPCRCGVH